MQSYPNSCQLQSSQMKFQLSVELPSYPFKINHDDKVFFIGSCFSEHISEKMSQNGFFVESNPWGILFNPMSMGRLTKQLMEVGDLEKDIIPVFRENRWFSLHQHSHLNDTSDEGLRRKIKDATQRASFEFGASSYLILTFGTAMVYEYLQNGEVVANCQKIPQQQFKKRLLGIDEMVEVWSDIIEKLEDKKIIFTVSPVRHSKDGLIENNRSKAVLILAIQQLVERFPDRCFYFPSYEIIMDELRDYRFFEADMVHPNLVSIEYVWEKFMQTLFSSETQNMAVEFNRLYLFSRHQPMYGNVELHIEQVCNMIEKCRIAYPNMNYLKILGVK